jgi:hypothetical protein
MKKIFLSIFMLVTMGAGLSAQTAIIPTDGVDGRFGPVGGGPPNWVPVPNLLYNMQVIAKLKYADGSFSLNANDVVGAFSGNECRGVMSPNPGFFGILFLTVGSNSPSGETITFKAYLSAEDVIVDLNQTLVFLDQQQIGSVANPFIFTYPPVIPDTLLIRNVIVAAGESRCFAANTTIIAAGSGTWFTVESGATVYLGAGQNTRLLPGTHFKNGSQAEVTVGPGGTFCSSHMANSGSLLRNLSDKPDGLPANRKFCRIFPNPTSGILTLEILDSEEPGFVDLTVYTSTGTKFLHRKLSICKKNTVDISGLPVGIYTFCVVMGDKMDVDEVVKN